MERILFLLSALLSAGAFFAGWTVLGSRSQEANALLFGYSAGRLALAGVLTLAGILFGWLGLQMRSWTFRARRFSSALIGSEAALNRLFWVGLVLCFLGWAGSATPVYQVPEDLAEYLLRLRPLMLWLAGAGASALLLLLEVRRSDGKAPVLAPGSVLQAARLTLIIFMLIWLLVSLTGLGLGIREDYWYGAGVPALPLQVLASIVAGLLMGRLEILERVRAHKRLDLLLFLLFWVLAAVLWVREPLHPTYFMPGPSFPNREFYPFSDASDFDLGSQFALIGQGLFNGQYFDRILYSAFLTYLHALAGQNLIQAASVQAAIFAIFPALAYLIGSELEGRSLGTASAVMIALRGANSIAVSGWVDLASPKMLLTDFPTAVLLALFTLLIIRWLKDPTRQWRTVFWAGCVLGLTLLLRTHALLLLPLLALFALLTRRFSWRSWLGGVSLLALGMVLVTLPWDLLSQARGAPPFSTFTYRIGLILKYRYPLWQTDNPSTTASRSSSFAVPESGTTASAHTASLLFQDRGRCEGLVCSGVNHYLHNFVTSVLSLPTSPGLDNLRETVKTAYPYWQQAWLGEGFTLPWGLFLASNLALIALGIGAGWMGRGWPGFVPLFVYLGYSLSNAFALTSGGRYIVPTDWIVYVYFLSGALIFSRWVWNLLHREGMWLAGPPAENLPGPGDLPTHAASLRTGLLTAVLILAIGGLIPLAEVPFPERYADVKRRSQVLTLLVERELLQQAGLDLPQIRLFLAQPDARLIMGRGLYPRFYEAGRGITSRDATYQKLDYPRLAFTLIGPGGRNGVILPGRPPFRFPNASDVIVMGCRNGRTIDALAVFVLGEHLTEAYRRWPDAPLECPVKPPVCVEKGTCY